jgi:hypothetical protein
MKNYSDLETESGNWINVYAVFDGSTFLSLMTLSEIKSEKDIAYKTVYQYRRAQQKLVA